MLNVFSMQCTRWYDITFSSFQLFLLEEMREKRFDQYARVIQKAFKRYFNSQMLLKQKEEAAGKENIPVKSLLLLSNMYLIMYYKVSSYKHNLHIFGRV